MRLSNPTHAVFKSSFKVCLSFLPFASTKHQQETPKVHREGIAPTGDSTFAAQPWSVRSGAAPSTAWQDQTKPWGWFEAQSRYLSLVNKRSCL